MKRVIGHRVSFIPCSFSCFLSRHKGDHFDLRQVAAMKCMKAMGPEMDGDTAGPSLKKAKGVLESWMKVGCY